MSKFVNFIRTGSLCLVILLTGLVPFHFTHAQNLDRGISFLNSSPLSLSAVSQRLSRGGQWSLRNFEAWSASSDPSKESCRRQYQHFFQDGILRISISLGYHDWPAENRARDQETYNMVISALTAACQNPLDSVCGFEVIESPRRGMTVLQKALYPEPVLGVAAPVARVEIVHSSWSEVDSDNLYDVDFHPDQRRMSEAAEDFFLSSLSGTAGTHLCEVCIYMGHSRNGGGPDFYPVPLNRSSADRKPVYSHYLKERRGYQKLVEALEIRREAGSVDGRTRARGLLALLGCNSRSKFYPKTAAVCLPGTSPCLKRSLSDSADFMGFVLSDDLSWPRHRGLYFAAVLDGALSLKCRKSWGLNVDAISKLSGGVESYNLLGSFLTGK